MERWRWVPRDLGKAHVVLNIPDFTLGSTATAPSIWTTRVVVGKPDDADAAPHRDDEVHHRQSDLERAAVDRLQRISAGAAAGSDRAQAHGPQAAQDRDGSVHISQPPGESNALGRIRFNFPNKFLVYQHDTPDKHLFAHDGAPTATAACACRTRRNTPRCCCRSRRPAMSYTRRADQEDVRPLRDRHALHQPDPGPHHLPDRFVDDAGKLQIREDVYGRDAACSPRSRARSAGTPTSRSSGRSRATPAVGAAAQRRRKRPAIRAASRSSTGCSAAQRQEPPRRRPAPGEPRDHPLSTENAVSASRTPLIHLLLTSRKGLAGKGYFSPYSPVSQSAKGGRAAVRAR